MLRFLSIRHLAVIDELAIDLDAGLTVLTGETGAGKSMLVEALDLLVGGRASADLVRTGEDHAVIQAIFERPGGQEVIVRREISAQGRSRAFIGDALATTAALKELGHELLELHGQHEHQSLLDPAAHGPLLDATLDDRTLIAAVEEAFGGWTSACAAVERSQMHGHEKAARIDLLTFQLAEIDKVRPQPGEDAALADERTMLANADRLSRLSTEAYGLLYDEEGAALAALGGVWKRLADLAELDARARPYLDQRDDVKSRLEDLVFFLRDYAADLDASPARLQEVEDRLAAIERLKRKYGPSMEEVLARQGEMRTELDALGASDDHAAALVERAARATSTFQAAAAALSAARGPAAAALSTRLERALASLAMPKCRVDVRVRPAPTDQTRWSARGFDDVEFFLSPNPGEDLRPLARIASGGELSRVMLALHDLSGTASRTLVFDEVDAGIGGEAADAVGARLQHLARATQVICVTHLPQIAARADVHFSIDKHVRAGRTHTVVARLDRAGREQELGRMIAGAAITPAVLASARDMLAARERGETNTKGESETRPKAKAKAARA